MNKKVLVALVSTLAFGTVSVAHAADEAKADSPAAAKPAKESKGKGKGDAKGKDDAKKGDDTKAAKPIPPPPT